MILGDQRTTDFVAEALDSINRKMGKDMLFLASSGIARSWRMKQGNRTPCYTTSWGELAVARC